MHEFSIARSLLELIGEHVPDGVAVCAVRVRVGPMQAIEPEAMRMAWRAAAEGTACQDAELDITYLRWELNCRSCGNRWFAGSWPNPCRCGCYRTDPIGADELTLMSIDVQDPADAGPTDAPADMQAASQGV